MMQDLETGVLEIFAEAAGLPERFHYHWPLYLPRRMRKKPRVRAPRLQRSAEETKRMRYAKQRRYQKADRERLRAARMVYRVEPLPYPTACRLCRELVHSVEGHVGNCRALARA